jgi:hypothetical protein
MTPPLFFIYFGGPQAHDTPREIAGGARLGCIPVLKQEVLAHLPFDVDFVELELALSGPAHG